MDEYSKRRGVEISYGQMERMRDRTRTRAHGPRVAYMVPTAMLFNAWIMVDALHRLACAPGRTRTVIGLHSAPAAVRGVLWPGPGPPA